ncbi:helix-turn-helix domain-containing protein [Enterococcus faecalis]|uniref:helix-turn-helix domain-containing protein n=1 Tax=Enterococcus faecalis TaxID=1351 RepID=UPI0034CF1E0A
MQPLELAKFFLTKSQIQKIISFEHLKLKNLSVGELGKILGTTKRKTKEIINSLSEEMNVFLPNVSSKLKVENEKILFVPELKESEYVEISIRQREAYLSESSLFQVLLFVLENRKFSILQLSRALSYSESYSYKLYGKLINLLNFMDLGIYLGKENDTFFQLQGDESCIRILHFLCVSGASKGNRWFFTNISEKEILDVQSYVHFELYDNLSPIGKNRVNYMLAVYELALKNGYKLANLDENALEIGNAINREKEIGLYLKYLREETKRIDVSLHDELIQLAFLLNYYLQELRTDKEKAKLGEALFSIKDNKIVDSCKLVLNGISKKYNVSMDLYFLLLYSLCNRMVVIHYMGLFNFMDFYRMPPISKQMAMSIEECLEEGLDAYKTEPSFSKVKHSFAQFLAGYLALLQPKSQKIYLEFFHRPEYTSILSNAIKHNYNKKVLQVTQNYSEADIVISDTFDYDGKEFFHFKDIFDKESWRQLGFFLNEIIIDKDLSR